MSITRGMDKGGNYVYTVGYYSALKKNEMMPFAATWIDPEIVMLNEVSQNRRNVF